MVSQQSYVEYERHDRVALIRMNRPERLNALSLKFMHHLADCWNRFRDDDEAWIAVLTGCGRAFSTGMDIKELVARNEPYLPTDPGWPENPWWDEKLDKPTIAAIQGYAYGGGFYFASKCDLRIAAENALFQITEPLRGGIAGYEMLAVEGLPYAIVAELATGQTMTAERAYQVGFVNRLVPEDSLIDSAMEWAEQLCAAPPLAVYHNLRILRDIRRNQSKTTYWQQRDIDRAWTELNASRDTREAFESFMAKRPARYERR
jgi:enoyl-CoA hydratase